MEKRVFMGVIAVLALGACGKPTPGTATNGSANSGAQSAAGGSAAGAPASASAAAEIQPGEWEVASETLNVTGTGIPPQALAAMRNQKHTDRHCITPEEARHPLKTSEDDKSCDYSHFTMGSGTMKGTVTCGAGGSRTSVAMDGQFTPQSYSYTSRMTSEGHGGSMVIEVRAIGRRIGECPAGSGG